MQQLAIALSYAESKGVSAAATALESEALKIPTGVTSDMHAPSIAEYAAAAASGAPASAAAASPAAGDISIAAGDESATAAGESTTTTVDCKSTTVDELSSCLVASGSAASSMPERLDVTSHGQLSSVDAWLYTLGGISSRLATALMSDLVACSMQYGMVMLAMPQTSHDNKAFGRRKQKISSLPSSSHTTDAADLCNPPAGTQRPIIAWPANCMPAEIGVLPKWLFLASLAAIVRSAALLLHPLRQRLLSISVAAKLAAALQPYACL